MNSTDTIYDRFGRPQLILTNTGRVIDFKGKSLVFLVESALYNYSGKHVGWYEGGIVRDLRGQVVGFGDSPHDFPHPILPIRGINPIAAIPQIERIRPIPNIPYIKPIKSFGWST